MNVMLVHGSLQGTTLYMFLRLLLLRQLLSVLLVVVAQQPSPPSIALTTLLTSLGSITDIQYAPGDDGDGLTSLFVVTREGQIKIVEGAIASSATVRPTPFLDISSRVKSVSERGLLGLAFHPEYATNGYVFVNYIYRDPNQPEASCQDNSPGNAKNTRISRFTAAVSTSTIDPTTELVIAEIAQPYCNHNGGQLRFGLNDGYLYIGLGDGGNSGDPQNNARDLTTYLGKLLRVDVNGMDESSSATVTVNKPRWKIPSDNPTASCTAIDPNALDEIIGYGLRNPWRFTFDRVTGDLWIADVGQKLIEEVNFIPSNDILRSCHNFGWNYCEGTSLFTGEGTLPSQCSSCSDSSCFAVPVLGYGREKGGSVTGGHVYRGQAYASELNGLYFYADFVSGHIWGARSFSTTGTTFSNVIEELSILSSPTTFGEDVNGELFVGSLTGTLYRIEAKTPSPTPMTPGPGPLGDIVKCPTSSLENSLDIKADLRFSYQVLVPDNDADISAYGGVLCAELVYQGYGWIALAMTETGTMQGSQAIIGRPEENSVRKYDMVVGSIGLASNAQTLRDTMIEQRQTETGTTRMRFTKILKEEGEIEIDGSGLNTFLWAHGMSNKLDYHGSQNRGSFNLILSPMEKSVCPTWLEWLSILIRIITFGLVGFC